MRGIILAGGTGSRLHPLTIGTSKQLLPVFDKPMIYYPLSTLMLAGIKEILVITTPHDAPQFQKLLGDGSQWGISIEYAKQPSPDGLAQALIIGEEFINSKPVSLILGDNIFFGSGMGRSLSRMQSRDGATIFAYRVSNPQDYGVVEIDRFGKPVSLVEKPRELKSALAVPGLYFFDGQASQIARAVVPSNRGELEIISVLEKYLDHGNLHVEILDKEQRWMDAGTIEALFLAGSLVSSMEKRFGSKINIPEEVAWRQGFINDSQLLAQADLYPKSGYGEYLAQLVGRRNFLN
jgi:glucose-1-phosphate thymidylyltransferase